MIIVFLRPSNSKDNVKRRVCRESGKHERVSVRMSWREGLASESDSKDGKSATVQFLHVSPRCMGIAASHFSAFLGLNAGHGVSWLSSRCWRFLPDSQAINRVVRGRIV